MSTLRRWSRMARRAGSAGIVSVMVILMRVPAGVRGPVLRPVTSATRYALERRPGGQLLPALAFIAERAAGHPKRAAALAERIGTASTSAPRARVRLARLALAAGQASVAIAITDSLPEDRTPELDAIRSEIAFDDGRYSEAVSLASRASSAGVKGAAQLETRARSHLTVLQPGWLPDPGPAGGRLAALHGGAVPGRVLHVVSVSLPHRLAGYTVRTQSVARCQAGVGLDPHVMARTGFPVDDGAGLGVIDVVDGISYHRVPPPAAATGPDRVLAGVVRNAVALLEEFRPAVLQPASNHLQAQVALALGRHAGIPVVYEVRGFWEESWASHSFHDEAAAMETERYLLTRAAETSAMLAADAVVTLSETMRAEIIMRGCDPGKVVIVPNAVDVEQFQPAPRDDALGSSLGIAPGDPVVGYISSFNAYEGIPYLLEAVAMLRAAHPRIRVLLVGDGEEAETIREAASRLGLDDGTLVMPGRVPHGKVRGYYSLIDVFVVPRTAHRVSRLVTPLKPYEAMALERAVVASDLPALREIVTPEETGLTFRAEDSADLAAVLGRLLDDPSLRVRLGRQAREWILAERTWAANGTRYRELFERLGVA